MKRVALVQRKPTAGLSAAEPVPAELTPGDIEQTPAEPVIARRSLTFSPERSTTSNTAVVPAAAVNPLLREWFMRNAYAIAQTLAAQAPGTCRVRAAAAPRVEGECDSPALAAALRALPEASQQALAAGFAGGLAQEIVLVAMPQRVDVVLR